jgi:hypothetical protein
MPQLMDEMLYPKPRKCIHAAIVKIISSATNIAQNFTQATEKPIALQWKSEFIRVIYIAQKGNQLAFIQHSSQFSCWHLNLVN